MYCIFSRLVHFFYQIHIVFLEDLYTFLCVFGAELGWSPCPDAQIDPKQQEGWIHPGKIGMDKKKLSRERNNNLNIYHREESKLAM